MGGGRETGNLRIDRGEKIVNRKTDTKGLVFIETNPPGAISRSAASRSNAQGF